MTTRLPGTNTTFHHDHLPSDEYYALLTRADLILLPYDSPQYRSGTSGIFAEALAMAKPVVVPRGTWMARNLDEGGAGVAFQPGSGTALGEAIRAAVNDIGRLSSQARERAPAWRVRHSPAAYFDALTSGLGS